MRPLSAIPPLLALLAAPPLPAKEPKMTSGEVVARHLEAVGPAAARAAARTRIAEGGVFLKILVGGSASLQGRAIFYSDARSLRASLRFPSEAYHGESFGIVDGEVDIGFAQPGQRSPIGSFLAVYADPLREGLLGGVLSASWPLLEPAARGAKVAYDGIKEVEGKPLQRITYNPAKRRNDMRIQLFFDPETFRHVRTTYHLTMSPHQVADITKSSQQEDKRYDLEETFDRFEPTQGLTLPRLWTLRFGTQGAELGATLWRFDVDFDRVRFEAAPPDTSGQQ